MKPRPQDIISAVSVVFEIRREDLLNATRGQFRIAFARQAAMTLCRELTDWSLPRIGNQFGRDHTTVLHAVKRTMERAAGSPSLRDDLERCRGLAAVAVANRERNLAEIIGRPLVAEAAE
jgi:chromosomal replication initiator protein